MMYCYVKTKSFFLEDTDIQGLVDQERGFDEPALVAFRPGCGGSGIVVPVSNRRVRRTCKRKIGGILAPWRKLRLN